MAQPATQALCREKRSIAVPAEAFEEAEYIDSVPDPKGRDYIVASHLFKTVIAESDSWIIVNETIWNEFLVHSISDNIPQAGYKKQDL